MKAVQQFSLTDTYFHDFTKHKSFFKDGHEGGEKIEEGMGLTEAQKVLREREVLSLWLAVIWIKVHAEVVNDLNSKTCYYNWSKRVWSAVVSYSSRFV